MTNYIPPQGGESGGSPDTLGYTERSDIASPGNRRVEEGGNLAGPSHRSARVQRSRKAKEVVDLEIATPSRRRVRRRNPVGQRPTTLVSFLIKV